MTVKFSSRLIKISGIVLLSVATLVIATALFLPYLLDVNAYRSEIVTALQKSLNRPVSFSSGAFAWHYGPSFQFKSFVVKERQGENEFISAKQITVQVALLPLLRKKIEIRKLILDAPFISLSRAADGTMNIDDLLVTDGSEGVSINFKQVRINKGAVQWRDQYKRPKSLDLSFHNILLSADNLGRAHKGHFKLSGDLGASGTALGHVTLDTSLRLPDGSASLAESVLDGDITLKQIDIGTFWGYFGTYVPFENTGGKLNVTTSFKGKVQDFAAKGKIVITGSTVKWPTIFHAVLTPKNLQLEYVMTLNRQQISLSAVDLSMEGFRIKGSFQLLDYLSKDPKIIAKAVTPSTFNYEDIRYYVPYGIIDKDTSDYIENKIKSGAFKLTSGVLDGRISQIAHMEIGQNGNTLYIHGTAENAVLSYGPKAPAFNALKGIIELKGNNFNLIGMSGNFGTSPFTLNGSITEYNTYKTADYPIKMSIAPRAPEMAWLAKMAGIPKLEYSNSSTLQLTGSGHYTAYKLNGDWDLKLAAYALPGYVAKPLAMPNTLKFATVIGKDATKVTSVNYALQSLALAGNGLIGYGDKPYLGFDLTSNSFTMSEALPIIPMWKKYNIQGTVQTHIKGGGDPADMSAMDYNGVVNLTKASFLPDEQLKQISGISGQLYFKGNSLESSRMAARYGDSVVTIKAAIKSLKRPEGDISLSTPLLYLHDLNLAPGHKDAAFKRLNGSLTLRNDAIVLNNISGLLNSSNFNIKGEYLTGRTRQFNAALTSTKLDIDDLKLLSAVSSSPTPQKSAPSEIKLTLNVDSGNFGKVVFSKLATTIQEENGTYYLQNLTAGLYGGKFSAKGRIAPGGELGDRYDLTVDVAKSDADKLFTALDITREVTGTLSLQGSITARGNSFAAIKKSSLGNIKLSMNNGTLRKFSTLSKVFSILNISQLLKFKLPDMASGGMPYSTIKGSFAVKDGVVSTSDLFISSNAINMSVIGNADIVKEELNFTIGAQPLQTVDKIVNKIPIVGWLLTGKDKDLLTAYFEAKGKWSDPQVSAIPVKSMGKGLLNIFVRTFELPVKLFTDTGEVILGQ